VLLQDRERRLGHGGNRMVDWPPGPGKRRWSPRLLARPLRARDGAVSVPPCSSLHRRCFHSSPWLRAG